ncbi:valine--tRNA ligase [bacterium]|nr:valine--tRNA ligase [bacterium]
MDIPKTYDPNKVEAKYAKWWQEKGFFKTAPDPDKEPFTIMMPPPNVTGVLHMGHALQDTIQDTLIRYHRMQGFEAHWQAGKDHAGIATQTVVEKELKKNRQPDRRTLGRDKFIEEVWKVVERNQNVITRQKMAMGDSADWSRERFTLDEGLSRAVREVFVRLYEDGLIYRGPYIVNWSPALGSAISDEEVDHRDEEGHLWHIRYPGVNGGEGAVVATTRPETMLGDTAVMVHPEDERYQHLIGKEVELPLTGRRIPVIADDYVDREFGTGTVKVTPAHDPNDFEVGKRHNLPMPVIMDTHAQIQAPAPEKYIGMDRFKARDAIIKDLEEQGLLVKVEKHQHAVGYCHRTKVPIEPYLSTQWFLKMKPLADPAIEAVRNGEIQFVPNRWEKVYFQWLENIRDWCISRQLWWGHRIPAWYCDNCDEMTVSREDPGECSACGSKNIRQDEDVLDTWFSSWIWPFSTLGWPDETDEIGYYHPTDVLVSGYDIIFFWIARMIMADLYFTGHIPYKTVYITGMIKDKQGRWMSKSLGNGIDPLEMIEQYGADAVRYSLTVLTTEGQDINLDPTRFEMGRNFTNKLWNAFRFVASQASELLPQQLEEMHNTARSMPDPLSPAGFPTPQGPTEEANLRRLITEAIEASGPSALEDRWIRARYVETVHEVEDRLSRYKMNEALLAIYRFTWNEFCDWYIESIKPRISYDANANEAAATLRFACNILEDLVCMLHPFMPFITEEIYQLLGQIEGRFLPSDRSETVSLARWHNADVQKTDDKAIEEYSYVQELVSAVRNVRGELLVAPSKNVKIALHEKDPRIKLIKREWSTIQRLAKLEDDGLLLVKEKPALSATTLVEGRQLFVPLEGLIDIDAEKARVEKEVGKLDGLLMGVQKKLENKKFVDNAPGDVVKKERDKLNDYEEKKAKLVKHLEDLLG